MVSLEVVLSLSIYAILCVAIARIFARTGHGLVWQIASFLPFLTALAAYGLEILQVSVALGRAILPLVVLTYAILLIVLASKRWPTEETSA